jgi:hypothetical protein
VLCGALRDALSASAPVFASGSLTGPACVCTTRLATVVIDVGHADARRDLPGDLVHVPCGGDAGADVDDLPYARLAGQEPHRPLQERPVSPRGVACFRRGLEQLADGLPVGGVVVLAAQILIIYWAGNRTCGPGRGYVMSA